MAITTLSLFGNIDSFRLHDKQLTGQITIRYEDFLQAALESI